MKKNGAKRYTIPLTHNCLLTGKATYYTPREAGWLFKKSQRLTHAYAKPKSSYKTRTFYNQDSVLFDFDGAGGGGGANGGGGGASGSCPYLASASFILFSSLKLYRSSFPDFNQTIIPLLGVQLKDLTEGFLFKKAS